MKKSLIALVLLSSMFTIKAGYYEDPYVLDPVRSYNDIIRESRETAQKQKRATQEQINQRLHTAVEKANIEEVKKAINDGANVQSRVNGMRPYDRNQDKIRQLGDNGNNAYDLSSYFDPNPELQNRYKIQSILLDAAQKQIN